MRKNSVLRRSVNCTSVSKSTPHYSTTYTHQSHPSGHDIPNKDSVSYVSGQIQKIKPFYMWARMKLGKNVALSTLLAQ